jgi:hypothetical protein
VGYYACSLAEADRRYSGAEFVTCVSLKIAVTCSDYLVYLAGHRDGLRVRLITNRPFRSKLSGSQQLIGLSAEN